MTGNAEKTRSIALYQAQADLTQAGNAINATFVASMADAVRDYGIAQAANSSAMQLGMLQSNGAQSLLVAQAQKAYDIARAELGSTQMTAVIQASQTWKLTEKEAAHQLALDHADADELLGQAINDALSNQQQTVVSAQLPWTLVTNAAIEQLTATTSTAGKVYSMAIGLAQNEWQTATTLAQADVGGSLTGARNNYQTAMRQSIVQWQLDVIGAQVTAVNSYVSAANNRALAETLAWQAAQSETAYARWFVAHGWDVAEQTHWSDYQRRVALAWYDFALVAAPANSTMRRNLTTEGNQFYQAYAQAAQTAAIADGTSFLSTASANAIWNGHTDAVNAAENALTVGHNAAWQGFLVNATASELAASIAIALEDSTLATTAITGNNSWAATERGAAAAQQSSAKSAYHSFAVATADAVHDFSVTDANETATRDLLQNAAEASEGLASVDIPVNQQTAQWSAMSAYSEVQTDAARTWGNTVKEAAALLKKDLNAAEAQAVDRVADIVAEFEILAKQLEINAQVQSADVRQQASIHNWEQKLASHLAAPLSEFQ